MIVVLAVSAGAGLRAQPFPAGPEFQINESGRHDQVDPSVVTDASGAFLVVWGARRLDGTTLGIFGRRFDSLGAPLGGDFVVSDHAPLVPWAPRVAMGTSGDFVAAWTGQDGYGPGVAARMFDGSGVPLGAEFQVNEATAREQWFPTVARDPDEGFVVAWRGAANSSPLYSFVDVFGRRYDSSGNPRGDSFLVNAYTTDLQVNPSVASDPSGGFVIVWSSDGQDGSSLGAFGRRYDSSGAPLGGEFQINTYTTESQFGSRVAADPWGNFLVVWLSFGQDGAGWGLFGRRFDSAGAPLGGEFQVSASTSLSQMLPSMSFDDQGRFVIVWGNYDHGTGEYVNVYGRAFDASGAPRGAEFRISNFEKGFQRRPSVAFQPSGRFVVVWAAYEEETNGDAFGVFGRRFCFDADPADPCNAENVFVTAPLATGTLDCREPALGPPTIEWTRGRYERFKVLLSADPAFSPKSRLTSGDAFLKGDSYTPSRRQWKRACSRAIAANPSSPVIHLAVLAVDTDLAPGHPDRRTLSPTRQVSVAP